MVLALLTWGGTVAGPTRASAQGYSETQCPSCAQWNVPHAPAPIFGNSYYVGTDGLSAILVTSTAGHVLIDAGLPESAPHVLANIRALGFRVEDVKLILNSHAHYDHAGGIAQVAKATGARVVASAPSAAMIRTGRSRSDDPQFGVALAYPAFAAVRELKDGDTLRVGSLALVAHVTPGHTAGGTTWSWQSCEGDRCLALVYADSFTPISDSTFKYSGDPRFPTAASDLRRSLALLDRMRCDILVTPHPGSTNLWARLANRGTATAPMLIDTGACRRYAANAAAQLDRRLSDERSPRTPAR